MAGDDLSRGWAQTAKLCGFYAPDRRQVQLSNGPQARLGRLEQTCERELLELLGEAEDSGYGWDFWPSGVVSRLWVDIVNVKVAPPVPGSCFQPETHRAGASRK